MAFLSIVGRWAGSCRPLWGVQRPDSRPTPGPAGVKGRPQVEREPERSGGSQRALDAGRRPRCHLPGGPRHTSPTGESFGFRPLPYCSSASAWPVGFVSGSPSPVST
jgi:hypothetical protein